MSDDAPELPDGWHDPAQRVPRQGQEVRVWTRRGVDRLARFVVSHTDHWPAGASWVVEQGQNALPFEAAVAWSPHLDRPYPASRPDPQPSAPPAPAPAARAEPAPSGRPAILREVTVEVAETGDVLRRLPASQLDWSPHPSIPSLRVLALRLVRLAARIEWIMDLDSVETAFEPDLPHLAEPDEIIATFLANAGSVEALARRLGPDDLRAPWTLERNGAQIAQLPRGDALRQFGLTPLVYHRGEAALLMTAVGVHVPDPCPVWSFRGAPAQTWAPASPEPEGGGGQP